MLIALLEEHGGHWIFTAPPGHETPGPVRLEGDTWLHPVNLSEETRHRHYDVISIQTFLGLLHYLHDTSMQPFFDDEMQDAWTAYESVNQTYAKRLAGLAENAADEWILINDPHLMLVPEFFAGEVPVRRSRLAYFLGTPWCEPDYFCILPSWLRTTILRSLLRCDVVGFHAGRWADAFLACCARFLPDARIEGRTVTYEGRTTRVVAVPFPVDVDVLERMRDEPATKRWEGRLAEIVQGRRAMVRADRLDLWKNLPRGFAAYEALLRRRPALADECWFGAVVTTPSRAVGRHREYQELTEAMVRRINDKFGSPGREAVSLVYPGSNGDSRNCVVAALGMSQAALVNSTFDGLNLFAKEAALLIGDRASLLVSANAGVYEQLRPYATGLDPFDLDQTSTAMEAALHGGGDDGDRAAARRELLRKESAASWLEAVFAA
jgi:trehalose 6-phosphate synthase